MVRPIVPPGGHAGYAQMTPASKARLAQIPKLRNLLPGRKRRKKASGKKRRSSGRKRRGMKFGSPAWQKKYKVGKFRK